MEQANFDQALFREFYETRNITAVAVKMIDEPTAAWMSIAVVYGAIRIDGIHRNLFVKFPTWQHAAEFHHYAHDRAATDPLINDIVPMFLRPPRTYEIFVTDLKTRYTELGFAIATRTIMVEYE